MSKQAVNLKARLILYFKGQILLLKQTKPNGGNYTLVGGNVESEEYARQSLIREAYEEAGVIIKEEDLQLVHVLHKVADNEHRLVLYFKAYKWEGELKAKEAHKFKECEWFDLDNLPKNLTDTVRGVLREYRKGRLYSELSKPANKTKPSPKPENNSPAAAPKPKLLAPPEEKKAKK